MYTLDLHTHTRFFHGFESRPTPFDPVGVRLLAAMAHRRGIDAFATTNHDYATNFSLPGDVTAIPGIEVTTTRGHLLVVGPDPPEATRPRELTPNEVVAMAHRRDCAAIVPHPYRNSTVREADADFDAIELNGKGMDHGPVTDLAERLDLPVVGSSDAHYPIELGRAFTRVEADELTPESVVAAIRDGRVEAAVDERPVQRVLRSAYHLIHTRKGWLDQPTAPGIGPSPGEQASKEEAVADPEAVAGERSSRAR